MSTPLVFSRPLPAKYGLILLATASLLSPAYSSYRAFLSIPAGGVPRNIVGWLVTLFLRPFALTFSERRRLGEVPEDAKTHVDWSAIAELNGGTLERQGERPSVPYFLPQRQVTQVPSESDFERIHQGLQTILESHSQSTLFVGAKSVLERHSNALFLSPDKPIPSLYKLSRREFFHVHPADCSSHVILAPADAVRVIQYGWGERHSLSTRASTLSSIFPSKTLWERLRRVWRNLLIFGLPETYIMLYAPRNNKELQIAEEMVKGAVKYAETLVSTTCDPSALRERF